MLNKLIDQNKGKLTKDILKRAGIPYHGGFGNNVDSLQAVYDFSKKNMTAAEAEWMYRDEVINPNLDMAFFSVVMMPGGGSRVGNQKPAFSTTLTQAERNAVQRSSGAKVAGSASKTGETKTYPDGSVRDSKGRFAGSNGTVPGTPGVDKAIQQIKTDPKYSGYEVVGTEISVKSSDGKLRRYDLVVRKPDGTIVGIEVKSGSATRTAQQNRIDNELNANGGLATTGNRAKEAGVTRIDSVELIKVK